MWDRELFYRAAPLSRQPGGDAAVKRARPSRFFSTQRLMVVEGMKSSATSSVQSSIFDMSDYCLIEKNPACANSLNHF